MVAHPTTLAKKYDLYELNQFLSYMFHKSYILETERNLHFMAFYFCDIIKGVQWYHQMNGYIQVLFEPVSVKIKLYDML